MAASPAAGRKDAAPNPPTQALPEETSEERAKRGQKVRRAQQDAIFRDWFPEHTLRAAPSGAPPASIKHTSFAFPGLDAPDPGWLDKMLDHLRDARADALRHVEHVCTQADRLLSQAALVEQETEEEIKAIVKLVRTAGRLAGPEFVAYLSDKAQGKLGLFDEDGDEFDLDFDGEEDAKADEDEDDDEWDEDGEGEDDDDGDDEDYDEDEWHVEEYEGPGPMYIDGTFLDDDELADTPLPPAEFEVLPQETQPSDPSPSPNQAHEEAAELLLSSIITAPTTPPVQAGARSKRKRSEDETPEDDGDADNERSHKRQRPTEDLARSRERSTSPPTSRAGHITEDGELPVAKDKGKQPVYPPGSTLFWAQRQAALTPGSEDESASAPMTTLPGGLLVRPAVLKVPTVPWPLPGPGVVGLGQGIQAASALAPPAAIDDVSGAAAVPITAQPSVGGIAALPATHYDPSRDPRRRPRAQPRPSTDPEQKPEDASSAIEANGLHDGDKSSAPVAGTQTDS
ncbi:hypothetical protein PsYK624_096800 [Phanerochaete sordida]|uniref:Uncharacterized protein n=1 Tax=Phanerochaete sordida TaxID=48140 RepID=A0A9P3LFG6_9APHY|nr:hypothetical protein PsYK624_096800 [Phanerochaete sordida]